MQNVTVNVLEKDSAIVADYGIIISIQYIGSDCRFVVGYPGLPNVLKTGTPGEAVLIETPRHGIVEVRLLRQGYNNADFLISKISPQLGLLGAFTTNDPQNTPFDHDELVKIAESIDRAKSNIKNSLTLQGEQVDLIDRKLDEIRAASERLGRKDWLAYAGGALTSLCISAAFSPETTKSIFIAVGNALAWLLGNSPLLLT